MKSTDTAIAFVDELLSDVFNLKTTRHSRAHSSEVFVDESRLQTLMVKCQVLIRMLAPFSDDWKASLPMQINTTLDRLKKVEGVLEGIKDCLQKGRLVTITEQISVAVLGDLRTQATTLADNGLHLPACVVARAILEERLRLLCDSRGCIPATAKPSIDDYNQNLLRQSKAAADNYYTTSTMQWVTSIAGIGNEAAHATRPIVKADSERMLRELDSFLGRFSP